MKQLVVVIWNKSRLDFRSPEPAQAGTLRCSANEEGLHHPSCFPGDEVENLGSRTAGSNWLIKRISMGIYSYTWKLDRYGDPFFFLTMYIYIYTCIYVYMYICICIYVYVHIYIYKYRCILIYPKLPRGDICRVWMQSLGLPRSEWDIQGILTGDRINRCFGPSWMWNYCICTRASFGHSKLRWIENYKWLWLKIINPQNGWFSY